MSLPLRNVLVASLLLLAVLPIATGALLDAPKDTTVKIKNVLQTNDTLTVHCKSKDDDLGNQILKINEIFEFNFKTNIWRTTLFYCSFAWSDKFNWFDIFKAKRDDCSKCDWYILEAGPCLYGPDGLCFQWNRQ